MQYPASTKSQILTGIRLSNEMLHKPIIGSIQSKSQGTPGADPGREGNHLMRTYTEPELRRYASENAKTLVIRTYEDGDSKDTRRKSTKKEQGIIAAIIFGGLLGLRMNGSDHHSILATCEFIAMTQCPQMNTYDTIYQPIKEHAQN